MRRLCFLTLLISACAAHSETPTGTPDTAADTTQQDAAQPDEPIIYGVGMRVLDVTYQPRGIEGDRTLRVVVWYPTEDANGDIANYQGFIERDEVFVDATPAGDGPYPVLVFSHGFTSFAEQSFFMTEALARHGWLIVAPDHTGNTFLDFDKPHRTPNYLARPQDLTAALDAVTALPADDPLTGRVSDLVAVTGHSYGGYTTFGWAGATYDTAQSDAADPDAQAFCSEMTPERAAIFADLADPRVDVAIPMAPGDQAVFNGGASTVDVPVLMLTGALDNAVTNAANGDPYWASLDGENDLRVDITTAGHQSFSIACKYLGSLQEGDGCEGDQFIQADEGYEVINTFVQAYLWRHILQDESGAGVLNGSQPVHPAAIPVAK